MNNSNSDTPQTVATTRARFGTGQDELTRLKRELLQAEVRLAKARATMVTAEIDIKGLNARLREAAK